MQTAQILQSFAGLWTLATVFVLIWTAGVEVEAGKKKEDRIARGGGWGGHGGGGGGYGGGGGWGGGGWGNSQQYHYSSYPQHDGHYSGLSFDLSTGISAIGAILLLLALAAIIYPWLGKSGGTGWGWDSRSDLTTETGSATSALRSLNLMGTAEKVLTAVEKLYKIYEKNKKN